MINCYIINLDRDFERWQQIQTSFRDSGFNLIRFPGIDVSKQKQYASPSFVDAAKFKRLMGRTVERGEIGCYYSHLEIMKLFLNTDAPYCLVCEDDVYPVPQAELIIEKALEYHDHWDLLRLHRSPQKNFVPFTTLFENYELGTNFKGFAFTGSYLINRTAAEFFVKRLIPMSKPVDLAIFGGWTEVKEMSVFPPVFCNSSLAEESSIGQNRKSASPLNWTWWTALLEKYLSRKRKFAIQKKRIEQLPQNREPK